MAEDMTGSNKDLECTLVVLLKVGSVQESCTWKRGVVSMRYGFKSKVEEGSRTKWLAETVLRDGVGSEAIEWIQGIDDLAGSGHFKNFVAHSLRHLMNFWLVPEHSLPRKELADGAPSDTVCLRFVVSKPSLASSREGKHLSALLKSIPHDREL